MWLLRQFPRLSRVALRTYYRFERAGGDVPEEGPVLLVANHPNSLLDPAAVCPLAFLTLAVRDRWEEARASARAWLLLRRKGDLRLRLLERRLLLAGRLEELRRELEGDVQATAPGAGP